ncbi:cubilin-like isoform X2 [Pecten maximus]|uniref:cubilin-like isoform X2 n=1 Tax=Pecten maximus TaxID=6579 RepID=UPI001458045D|nr:cubilin-like isoform X2 [Pecten maximus]
MEMRLLCLMALSCLLLANGDAQDTCTNVDDTLEDFKVKTYFWENATGFNNDMTCSWTMRAVNQGNKIAYQLTDINLGVDDHINVYAGTSTGDQNVLTNRTGTSLSLTIIGVDSPAVHVVLQTGNVMQATRQSVNAYFMAGSDHSGAVSCVNQTLVAGAEPQFLTTPAFPMAYPVSKKCSWIITSPESATLELTFHMIDIEAGDSAATCNYDGLVVYLPGQKDTPELLVCRRNVWVPETHAIASNQVQLDFSADDSDSYGGFVLSYKAILPPTTTTTPQTSTGCELVSCVIPIVVVIVLLFVAVVVAVVLVRKRQKGSSKKYTPAAGTEPGEMKKMSPDAEDV